MLERLKQPVELFGHAERLKQEMMMLYIKRKKAFKADRELLKIILDNLEEHLKKLGHKYDVNSVEGFCCILDSMSRDEIIEGEEEINSRLSNCSPFEFLRLIHLVALKLEHECQDFLYEENRLRLARFPFTNQFVSQACLTRVERTAHFRRWNQGLVIDPNFKIIYLNDLSDFIFAHFYNMPYQISGLSLSSLLQQYKGRRLGIAGDQLEFTYQDGCSHIDAKQGKKALQRLDMERETFGFPLVSSAKQAYFQAPETFDSKLLYWIDNLAERENEPKGPLSFLKELTGRLYSFIGFEIILESSCRIC